VMNLEKMLTKALYFCLHFCSTLLDQLMKAVYLLREQKVRSIRWRLALIKDQIAGTGRKYSLEIAEPLWVRLPA